MPRKAVAHCSTSHAQEGGPGKPVEESGHEHGGHVLRNGAGDQPNEKEAVGDDKDRSAAVELDDPFSKQERARGADARRQHICHTYFR